MPGMIPTVIMPSLNELPEAMARSAGWPFDPALMEFGARITPANPQSGEGYWKLVEATGPRNMGGNHHLYVDVIAGNGKRAVGQGIVLYSQDEEWHSKIEEKPGEWYGGNFPLYAGGNAYGVYVSGAPSDRLFGVGLGNGVPHHSFSAVFQWTVRSPAPPPTPQPPADVLSVLRRIQVDLQTVIDSMEEANGS